MLNLIIMTLPGGDDNVIFEKFIECYVHQLTDNVFPLIHCLLLKSLFVLNEEMRDVVTCSAFMGGGGGVHPDLFEKLVFEIAVVQ